MMNNYTLRSGRLEEQVADSADDVEETTKATENILQLDENE